MSNNYLIAINKPQNWTSSDVVIKVRNLLSKALGEKVKIGHMGTLDPMATLERQMLSQQKLAVLHNISVHIQLM